MRKKLIIGSFIFVWLMLLGAQPGVATTGFVANGDVTVKSVVGSNLTSDLLIFSGSLAESWSYDQGSFLVTNPDVFRVGSSDNRVTSIRVYQNSQEEACSANSSPGTSYVALPRTGAGVFQIFPDNTPCAAAASAPSTGSSATASGSRPAQLLISRVLYLGLVGDDVKLLQQFLNQHGFLVATSGPGSAGQETTKFGLATRAAVIKFQLKSGIISSSQEAAAGLVGPQTRARIALIVDWQKQLQQLTEQLQKLLKK